LVEERYDRDVPVIENVFVKREGKGRESNVYIYDNYWRIVSI